MVSYKNISTARQLESMKDPQIETYKNTYNTNVLIQQYIIDSRKAERKANRQFIISLIISVSTLLFAAASFFVAL